MSLPRWLTAVPLVTACIADTAPDTSTELAHAPAATERTPRIPAADDKCWVEWARAVVRDELYHRTEDGPRASQILLRFGKRPARQALTHIIEGPEVPQRQGAFLQDRVCAAYCLAVTNLDYKQGRRVILEYLDALSPDEVTDPVTGQVRRAWEDHFYVASRIYELRRDEVILRKMMEVGKWSDGALTESLRGRYARVLLADPQGFLRALQQCSLQDRQAVYAHTARGLSDRAYYDHGESWRQATRVLAGIASNQASPLASSAQAMLAAVKQTRPRRLSPQQAPE
jgi:hypothetical protein